MSLIPRVKFYSYTLIIIFQCEIIGLVSLTKCLRRKKVLFKVVIRVNFYYGCAELGSRKYHIHPTLHTRIVGDHEIKIKILRVLQGRRLDGTKEI